MHWIRALYIEVRRYRSLRIPRDPLIQARAQGTAPSRVPLANSAPSTNWNSGGLSDGLTDCGVRKIRFTLLMPRVHTRA
jgi:hypothetical protein